MKRSSFSINFYLRTGFNYDLTVSYVKLSFLTQSTIQFYTSYLYPVSKDRIIHKYRKKSIHILGTYQLID